MSAQYQIDSRSFIDDFQTQSGAAINPANAYQANTILPRRVRLSEAVSLGASAGLFAQEEFNTVNPVLTDAYGELKPTAWATLRLGLQKNPLSLERWRPPMDRQQHELLVRGSYLKTD